MAVTTEEVTIGSILGVRSRLSPDPGVVFEYPHYIGLELELSDASALSFAVEPGDYYWWVSESDGSIRGRSPMELKFTRNPRGQHGLSPLEAETALKQLTNLPRTEVNDTCGLHVHIDVCDLTRPQLDNVVGLYLVVERVLYQYCGVDRADNNFCVPLHKALGSVAGAWAGGLSSFSESLRYGGLNLHAVRRFGTLEFRMHPGANDVAKIVDWINICAAIKEHGKNFEGPKTAYRRILGDVEAFMTDVFGSRASLLMYNTLQLDLERGLSDSKDMVLWKDVHYAQQKIRSRRSRKKEGTLWAQWLAQNGIQDRSNNPFADAVREMRLNRTLRDVWESTPLSTRTTTTTSASPDLVFFIDEGEVFRDDYDESF
jgi:hypothetical protein